MDDLWRAVQSGRKTLVFVRRIHSVPEMVEKLTQRYNDWLAGRIGDELRNCRKANRSDSTTRLRSIERQRTEFYSRGAVAAFAGGQQRAEDEPESASSAKKAEPAGFESFFSWFFRGEGPDGILSGASLSRNRLEKDSAQLSTLFEDNWLLWLLGYPADPLAELARLLGKPTDQLARRLRDRAAEIHPAKKPQKRKVFLAYQQAALEFIRDQTDNAALAETARTVLEQHQWLDRTRAASGERSFPEPHRYLGLKTFFTELAQRPALCADLWPSLDCEPVRRTPAELQSAAAGTRAASVAARFGHPAWPSDDRLVARLHTTDRHARARQVRGGRTARGAAAGMPVFRWTSSWRGSSSRCSTVNASRRNDSAGRPATRNSTAWPRLLACWPT